MTMTAPTEFIIVFSLGALAVGVFQIEHILRQILNWLREEPLANRGGKP